MATVSLPADATTLIINGRALTAFAEGDTITMTPANPATSRNNAIGGGVNINERSDRGVMDVVFRIQKYSEDDSFLNSLMRQSPPAVIQGSSKTLFNRDGENFEESYLLENGSFTTQPTDTKNSTDGNAMMEYTVQVRTGSRNL